MSKMNSMLMLALVLPLGMALAPPIADGPAKETGILVGEDSAAVVPLLRVGDGWDATVPYTPGTKPGDLQPAPPAYAAASPPPAQPPGGGSGDSVTTTVIVPVSTWAETCMISGNLKAIITATPNISGTASVVFKLKPMGCKGSCGVVNGQFTLSTTVTIGEGVVISCPLNFNSPQCHLSYADATCTFVVNADGTATVGLMVLHTGCIDTHKPGKLTRPLFISRCSWG